MVILSLYASHFLSFGLQFVTLFQAYGFFKATAWRTINVCQRSWTTILVIELLEKGFLVVLVFEDIMPAGQMATTLRSEKFLTFLDGHAHPTFFHSR